MHTSLISLATPAFLVFIALEWLIATLKKQPLYRLDDFINNITCGIYERIFTVVGAFFLTTSYAYLYHRYQFFTFSSTNPWHWLLLLLLVDLAYYWLHRATHRINFMWIGHSVHHQSEHYNLSVALRQGVFQGPTTWLFYLPIAIIGFPPTMFVVMMQLNTLYQFWIHTHLIDRMGPLEWVLNTPSHHRVHHGCNPQYIDKNYAGSLIIWDKLFGTFEKEAETVRFGVTEPLTTYNPMLANIKVLCDTWHYSSPLPLSKRLLCFFKPPEWILTQIGEDNYQRLKRPSQRHLAYHPTFSLITHVSIMLCLAYMFCLFKQTPIEHAFLITGIVLVSLSLGFILDGKKWWRVSDGLLLVSLFILLLLCKVYSPFFYLACLITLCLTLFILAYKGLRYPVKLAM